MLTVLSVILGALLLLIIWKYGYMVVYMIKTLKRRRERRVLHNDLPKALHPDLREPWKKILNQLDPVSFTRMGMSCTQMYELCISGAKGLGTKMDGRDFEIRVTRTATGLDFHCRSRKGRVVDPAVLRKWPIELYEPTLLIRSNKNYPLNPATLRLVSTFLRLIRVKKLGQFGFREVENCSNEIKAFSKEFIGEELAANCYRVLNNREMIESLTTSISFKYYHHIPNELLLRTRCRTLIAMDTRLSPNTFRKILENWHSDELSIGNWILGYTLHEIFKYIRVIESFIPFADRFSFDHVGVLPPKRPLLFFRGATNYWILRQDGTLLNCLFIVKDDPTFISFAGGKEFEREFHEFSFPHVLDKSMYFKKQ